MFKKIAFALYLTCLSNSSFSNIIYDTGPGESGGGSSVYIDQHLASKFTVENDLFIDSIEFWLSTTPGQTATITLYRDDGVWNGWSVPGTRMYTTDFVTSNFIPTPPQPLFAANWEGIKNLNWHVKKGIYWAAIEVLEGQSFDGGADAFCKKTDPVCDGRNNPASGDNFAFKSFGVPDPYNGAWRTSGYSNLAVGTLIKSVSVSAPGIFLIFIISLIILIRLRPQ